MVTMVMILRCVQYGERVCSVKLCSVCCVFIYAVCTVLCFFLLLCFVCRVQERLPFGTLKYLSIQVPSTYKDRDRRETGLPSPGNPSGKPGFVHCILTMLNYQNIACITFRQCWGTAVTGLCVWGLLSRDLDSTIAVISRFGCHLMSILFLFFSFMC